MVTPSASRSETDLFLLAGTYTRPHPHVAGCGPGLALYRFNLASGSLDLLTEYAGLDDPSFLVVDAPNQRLYTANETGAFHGQTGGSVAALSVSSDGALTLLNQAPTRFTGPCYVSLDLHAAALLFAAVDRYEQLPSASHAHDVASALSLVALFGEDGRLEGGLRVLR